MKRIHLTVVTKSLNEEGEKLVDRVTNRDTEDLPREWYIEQNLRPPKDLDEVEIDEEGSIILDEKYLESGYKSLTINLKEIESYFENEDGTTTLYCRSGLFYQVYETVTHINAYIDYLEIKQWKILLQLKLKDIWNSLKFFRKVQ